MMAEYYALPSGSFRSSSVSHPRAGYPDEDIAFSRNQIGAALHHTSTSSLFRLLRRFVSPQTTYTMTTVLLTVALLVLSGFLFLQRQSNSRSRTARFPPGPPGKLIVGNALDIPPRESWVWYSRLQKTYGQQFERYVFLSGLFD